MVVYPGHICGAKKQADKFVPSNGVAKGSYPIYVCTRPLKPGGRPHGGKHYDNVSKTSF